MFVLDRVSSRCGHIDDLRGRPQSRGNGLDARKVSRTNTGRHEDRILGGAEVTGGPQPIDVVPDHGFRSAPLLLILEVQAAFEDTAHAEERSGGDDALRCGPDAQQKVRG